MSMYVSRCLVQVNAPFRLVSVKNNYIHKVRRALSRVPFEIIPHKWGWSKYLGEKMAHSSLSYLTTRMSVNFLSFTSIEDRISRKKGLKPPKQKVPFERRLFFYFLCSKKKKKITSLLRQSSFFSHWRFYQFLFLNTKKRFNIKVGIHTYIILCNN